MTFHPLGQVVFVDDDPVVRAATVQSLELAGLDVVAFDGAGGALRIVDGDFNGVVVTDIRMPHVDGLQLLRMIHAIDATIPVILLTGHGDVPMAVAALRDGADDFLTKPFAGGHLLASVQRGLERRRLELDNRALRTQLETAAMTDSPLIGGSAAIERLRTVIAQVADAGLDVLIEGESGVGKELVALMLHRRSRRRAQPFVSVNCAAFAPGTAAAGLLGDGDRYRRGAPGQIAAAHRGTLFLDEVDRLDPEAQPLVLRAIEDGTIVAPGSGEPVSVDVRVIATAPEDLGTRVAAGTFRRDLYHALNVVHLRIPPLRERGEDIPLLFAHFVDEAATQMRQTPPRLTERVRRHLVDHDWPGNVRELRSFAYQTVTGGGSLPSDDAQGGLSLPMRVDRFEASAIRSALAECNGHATRAMLRLGIPRKTFYDKLQRHAIDIAEYRRR